MWAHVFREIFLGFTCFKSFVTCPHFPSSSNSVAVQTRNKNKNSKKMEKNGERKNGQKKGHKGTARTVKMGRKEIRKAGACYECDKGMKNFGYLMTCFLTWKRRGHFVADKIRETLGDSSPIEYTKMQARGKA